MFLKSDHALNQTNTGADKCNKNENKDERMAGNRINETGNPTNSGSYDRSDVGENRSNGNSGCENTSFTN